jgi:Putative auto-transporter adhesin, head GIN domain
MTAARLLAAAAFAGGVAVTVAMAQTAVPLAPFDNIELRGGGRVILRHGAEQRVTILKGSTQYTTFTVRGSRKLEIDACNSDCPANYDLEIEIVTPQIAAVAVSGGGAIESASGFPAQKSITAAVDGGGRIDMRAVDAESGTAAIDGGGKIEIRASGRLTAAVNGGGSIRYVGDPKVTTAIDGGGSVQPEGG